MNGERLGWRQGRRQTWMSDPDGTGRLGCRPRTESLAAPLFGRAPTESAQTRAHATPPAPPPTPTRRAASACRAKRCARHRRGPALVHCRRMRRGPTAAAVGSVGCLLSSCCRLYPPVTPTRRRVGSLGRSQNRKQEATWNRPVCIYHHFRAGSCFWKRH